MASTKRYLQKISSSTTLRKLDSVTIFHLHCRRSNYLTQIIYQQFPKSVRLNLITMYNICSIKSAIKPHLSSKGVQNTFNWSNKLRKHGIVKGVVDTSELLIVLFCPIKCKTGKQDARRDINQDGA